MRHASCLERKCHRGIAVFNNLIFNFWILNDDYGYKYLGKHTYVTSRWHIPNI